MRRRFVLRRNSSIVLGQMKFNCSSFNKGAQMRIFDVDLLFSKGLDFSLAAGS